MLPLALTATPVEVRSVPVLLRGDLAGAFRLAAESGCRGVEIHLRDAADVPAQAIRRLISEFRLAVPTLGTGMAATLDRLTLADPDPAVRAATLERLRGHLRLAAEIRSAITIGSVSGRLGPDESARPERRARALEALAQLCREAERLGVTVLLEPLNRYECDYLNTLADALAVVAEIQSPNLLLLADTFHMNIEETDMTAALVAAMPRLGHVHLADSNRQAPGRGHLDFAPLLDELVRSGYRGFLSFEVFPVPDPVTALRQGAQTVAALASGARVQQKGD
ncbi:MAG: sugar phosphate isomerase/epimerase family protein [Bryobacterales bacterium]|nr:sugar phosphate isomerase/epimerase [Bryobacteraceae bacterium]MDW8130845.1 sugar phosphate isomerase/epimerase family protein [Bryobacterales bacterium]